jgi:hypothetical protein
MVAVIDLLQDVDQKFTGTVVMYDKKACLIKGVVPSPDQADHFILKGATHNAREYKNIDLLDPALNYQNFNIGYANNSGYAAWWFRKPQKQWSQGLKSPQMNWRVGTPSCSPGEGFGFTKPFVNMLEGIYPNIEECRKALMDQAGRFSMAFHRDFAISYDELHEDFCLEHHGIRIGTSLGNNLTQFKIKAEARHLIEAFQEAQNVHA